MSFIAKNPIIAAHVDNVDAPPVGTRAMFAKEDGWYEIDDEGNTKKIGDDKLSHSHSNKKVLDRITQSDIDKWNSGTGSGGADNNALERLQYYGDTDIIPSPDEWFIFTPIDGKTASVKLVPVEEIDRTAFEELVIPYKCTIDGKEYRVTKLEENGFWNIILPTITIPNSIEIIGENTFMGCSFSDVNIPDSVITIEDYAFHYCDNLKTITIPNGVTSIGDYTFHSCTNLTQITIPDSVTSIGNRVFVMFDEFDNDIPIPNITIVCNEGSYAETYAKENRFKIAYDIKSGTETSSDLVVRFDFDSSNFTMTNVSHTAAEIYEAYQTGRVVRGIVIFDNDGLEIQADLDFSYDMVARFVLFINNSLCYCTISDVDENPWRCEFTEYQNKLTNEQIEGIDSINDIKSKTDSILNLGYIAEDDDWNILDFIDFKYGFFSIPILKWSQCLANAIDNGDFRDGLITTSGFGDIFIYMYTLKSTTSDNSAIQIFFDGETWYKRGITFEGGTSYTYTKLTKLDINKLGETKVDKEDGKGLSTNDFTDEYMGKIDNLMFKGIISESEIDSATSSGLYNVDASGISISNVSMCYYLFVNHESTEAEDLIYQYKFANGGVCQRCSIGADFSDATPIVESWTEWETINDSIIQTDDSIEYAQLGDEFVNDTDWTTTGWTGNFTDGFKHTTGNTNPLIFSMPEDTQGKYYQISFDLDQKVSDKDNLYLKIGSTRAADMYGQNKPYKIGLKATETGSVEFVPASDFTGTISNISIREIKDISGCVYLVKDSSGKTSFEVRPTKNELNNVFIGVNSGSKNIDGRGNVGIGSNALQENSSGFWNTAIGQDTLQNNESGSRNIAIGYISLQKNTIGKRNIGIGTFTLNENRSGDGNIALGADSQQYNLIGSNNVSIGLSSLYFNEQGSYNIAIGKSALHNAKNTGESGSIAIGYNAIGTAIASLRNIAIGNNALYDTNGMDNVAVGHGAGAYSEIDIEGEPEKSVGNKQNIFIGTNSGRMLKSGSHDNVFLGFKSGSSLATGHYNIFIGSEVSYTNNNNGSYQLNIGDLLKGSMQPDSKYLNIDGDLQVKGLPILDENGQILSDRLPELSTSVNIITSIESNSLVLEHNQEARLGTLDSMVLVFNTVSEVFSSYVCFTTSDNFTELQIVVTGAEIPYLKWKGDDVASDGTFTPVAGTMYEIAFKKVNTTEDGKPIIVARVGAV